MVSKNFKILITINVFIVIFLYIDYTLPSPNKIFENFSKLESYTKSVPSGKYGNRSAYENINLLYCKSQNIYSLFDISECYSEIPENQEIVIKKTILLSKIKDVEIPNKGWCKSNSVNFLSNNFVLFFFILSIFVSILSLFFSNTVLNVLLAFATVYIYFASVVYLFYIE